MRSICFLSLCLILLASCGSSSSSRSSSSTSSGDRTTGSERGKRRVQDPFGQVQIRKKRTFTKAELRERKRPSDVPGLTRGQVADMPDAPALPDVFGLYHTEEQLNAHAMLQAREDVQNGRAALFTIEQRYTYIRYLWLDEWQARKELLESVIAEQSEHARRIRHAAARSAAWERSNKEKQAAHQREMDSLERVELPVLTDAERRTINGM